MALSLNFNCAICLGSLTQPVVTPCGHRFDYPCILDWLKNHNTCPVDGSILKLTDLKPGLELKGRAKCFLRDQEEYAVLTISGEEKIKATFVQNVLPAKPKPDQDTSFSLCNFFSWVNSFDMGYTFNLNDTFNSKK